MRVEEFTDDKKEILKTISSIIKEKADNVISTSINENIVLKKKADTLVHEPTIHNSLGTSMVRLDFSFKDGFSGDMFILIAKSTVAQIADKMLMGEGDAEFDEMEHMDAIQEITNQILGATATELTGVFEFTITFTEVIGQVIDINDIKDDLTDDNLMVHYGITILDDSEYFLVIKSDTFENIIKTITDFSSGGVEEDNTQTELDFPEIGSNMMGTVSGGRDLGVLMDVRLPVTVELGRKKMFIRDILKLTPGEVVELPKLQGEPVDLFVNDRKFATGEVVVIAENFGIRIKSLITPEERLKTSDAWKDDTYK
ncbi:MAG: flagellar motor switch protein FliN [Candidatus Delongbacteria bacterium]|nr:flagellar motor switch protein FliN [Candidatus Delongbacteria bacterium]MBN2834714.1 flagellar motor switch protein FliN [Candidatus Delongbacteria bacterium]